MKLSKLHEEFIDAARRPMDLGKLPVVPKHHNVPIVATNSWVEVGSPKALCKKFSFRTDEQRARFLTEIIDYELQVKHSAQVTFFNLDVDVKLCTQGVNLITEIDREYSKYLDDLYKDVVYSNIDG